MLFKLSPIIYLLQKKNNNNKFQLAASLAKELRFFYLSKSEIAARELVSIFNFFLNFVVDSSIL